MLFLSKVPLEVLQNRVLVQLIVTPHKLKKVQGPINEMCGSIELCLLIGTRKYVNRFGEIKLKNGSLQFCLRLFVPLVRIKAVGNENCLDE